MIKIKVNLDEKNYNTLLSDMRLFSISKNDQSINKNKFMNLLQTVDKVKMLTVFFL